MLEEPFTHCVLGYHANSSSSLRTALSPRSTGYEASPDAADGADRLCHDPAADRASSARVSAPTSEERLSFLPEEAPTLPPPGTRKPPSARAGC